MPQTIAPGSEGAEKKASKGSMRDLCVTLASGSYVNKSLAEIVRNIIDTYLAPLGYSFGSAPNTAIDTHVTFAYTPVYACFDQLAHLWSMTWWVDNTSKEIHFSTPAFSPYAVEAPIVADALDAVARQLESDL